jgi:putative endonuclease
MLRRKGYKIVARGERNRLGELDLVAVDGRTVVFVEVRTRSSQDHGSPADTITPDKQRRVTRAAVAYLKQHGLLGYACRFDVVAITWPSRNAAPQIEHLVSAFDATGFRGMFS